VRLDGLKPDRVPVLPGGFAIMAAVFEVLGLEQMEVADGALRQGVLYDLLGRVEHHDTRDATIEQFARRYGIDRAQAARVTKLALDLYRQAALGSAEEREEGERHLGWAAALHEIGLSIAHAGYHKHTAYILSNADMPGFSKKDQAWVSALALGHTGKLAKITGKLATADEWLELFCLRIAVLVHRRRIEMAPPPLALRMRERGFVLTIDAAWLAEHPLTEFSLQQECQEWSKVGVTVELT